MNKILFCLLVLFSNLTYANYIDDTCPQFVIWGAPKVKVESNRQYMCKTAYAINYNYTHKTLDYAVELLDISKFTAQKVSRKNDFREDTNIPEKYRSTLKDYSASGYDRGHMAPAGDFAYDANVMSESFLLSNMVPQLPNINRGVWKSIEELVRTSLDKNKKLYVITGTIYDDKPNLMSTVSIPSYTFKIVIDDNRKKSIAFIVPNKPVDSNDPVKYITTIQEIEAKTGINFSPNLPKSLSTLESSKGNLSDW